MLRSSSRRSPIAPRTTVYHRNIARNDDFCTEKLVGQFSIIPCHARVNHQRRSRGMLEPEFPGAEDRGSRRSAVYTWRRLHALSMRAWRRPRRTLFTLIASRSRYFPTSPRLIRRSGENINKSEHDRCGSGADARFPLYHASHSPPAKACTRAASPASLNWTGGKVQDPWPKIYLYDF